MTIIKARPLTHDAFADFGDVIDTSQSHNYPINRGKCIRHHDLAKIETLGPNGRPLINIFQGTPYDFPLKLDMVERHPFGSQAFIPLSERPFLVIVCLDGENGPQTPQAFVTAPGQGVNYARNIWHGVLTPIGQRQDFLIVDRGGDGNNLEEFFFETPFSVELP